MEDNLNFNDVYKDKDKLEKELRKFAEKAPEDKCADLYKGFVNLVKNRFNSKRDDRMVLDFMYFRELTQKVRSLTESEISVYLNFILDNLNETLRYQLGAEKINNYTLFAEVVRNLPIASSEEDVKLVNEIKQKMKTFENELVKN